MNAKLALETAKERLKEAKAVAPMDDLTLAVGEVIDLIEVLLERYLVERRPSMFEAKVGRAGQIVIPQSVRNMYNLGIGSEVTLDLWMVNGEPLEG